MAALLQAVPVKRIFKTLLIAVALLGCDQTFALDAYETMKNGQVQRKSDRLYTKVILNGRVYARNYNRLSIARLYGQRNFLLYPYRQIEWDDQFSVEKQRILINSYLRLIKLSENFEGFHLERQWIQDVQYQFVFSIPTSQIKQIKITSANVISSLQQAIIEQNEKLDHVAILEIALQHPNLFDVKLIVRQLNTHYGKNLLKLISGISINNSSTWQGTDNDLSDYKLEDLLQLQSKHPYDYNVTYYLALAFHAHKYQQLTQRLIKNSLKIHSTSESYERLIQLAKTLSISYTPSNHN